MPQALGHYLWQYKPSYQILKYGAEKINNNLFHEYARLRLLGDFSCIWTL